MSLGNAVAGVVSLGRLCESAIIERNMTSSQPPDMIPLLSILARRVSLEQLCNPSASGNTMSPLDGLVFTRKAGFMVTIVAIGLGWYL